MSDNQNRKRNAGAQQARHTVEKNEHSAFDNLGLSKRNADYMFRFNQEIEKTKLSVEKKTEVVNEMVQELVDGQKSGKTAKNMYGDVSERIDYVVNGPAKDPNADDPYWPSALYNGLIFFMIFNVMFGAIMLLSPKTAASSQPVGIVSIFISSALAGLALPYMSTIFDPKRKHKQSIWVRLLVVIALFVVWMGLFYITSAIPSVANPVLQSWPAVIVGVLSGGGALLIRRQYGLKKGFLF
ncbi:DUF1129 domain-containing protein [Secundilactobacillus malefermentans]|uniref:DUF1129 domain-containing protein n=1 Tax=Secundilactobacillus malefermentans TaxID=176292 RepID=A0A4R5NLD9_9LACO|nr:DUF1129 domain-containing protein [Secundilactobacillus malefermentans]KRM59567.1 hypothetical protein FD44_GL001506 [Secundilactobacillus malefermentans DSM 5705 = KCTC 3548]QEA31819.1 DUF1129 domain-containing protein [Secundilactobacillus malefermentans]TDG75474.1 hypothetical protein C5L31_000348 [Secundilactobacillus malefermentans]